MNCSLVIHARMRGRLLAPTIAAVAAAILPAARVTAADEIPALRWEHAVERMTAVAANSSEEAFSTLPGFVVERLFTVPKEELGSWVAIAADPKGRLIASDQQDKGLVRITPAPLDGSRPTVVERIPAEMSAAQGLLWAFDSLYVVRNSGTSSGLYRLTDANGDDTLDTVTKVRGIPGHGEHGPHAVVLSPDGTRLVVLCGNHTKLPFDMTDLTPPQNMGGIRPSQRRVELPPEAASRLPANWDEDLIIPRMWDANGHAVGVLAPGGYVVSTDPEGKAWQVWSAGYRNPYDMSFNADGELFVYDADMEWDVGLPWYRPTRVSHATSGSEFGWRSGAGKWPACSPDSLPATIDIGPGSPVGTAFGYGAKFPARYQKAFFICDWTCGAIEAIHLEPSGASYKATRETFVSRAPLPLTDIVVGGDGAMYFVVGGRGGQSELYRVRYEGPDATAPVDARDAAGVAERQLRRQLEAFHRRDPDPAAAVALAVPQLASPDRFIRYAARIALEHQPLEAWQDRALALGDPRGRIVAAIAVARQAEPAAQPAVLAALDGIVLAQLDTPSRIDLVRAYELALVRLGEPSADAKARIATRLRPLFPSGSFELDRALASLLVAIRAPGIVDTLAAMLAAPTHAAGATNVAIDDDALRRLEKKNAGYGKTLRASLDRPSDLLQLHIAYVLRTVTEKDAWSPAARGQYLGWFVQARQWTGGPSYRLYLRNMEHESLAGLTENEKLALETNGIRTPYAPPPLPKPVGPGREWTAEELLAAAKERLHVGRDFERGKRAFAAARCIVCHRFGDDGGATGPDLTRAAGRFQLADLVEAIVHPSKVVSDQYRGSVVQTADGRVATGRIVSESAEAITLVTDPEDATKFVEIGRSDIEEILPAAESLMPRGLLAPLGEDEVLDLIAYVLSNDKPYAEFFKSKPRRP
jgi:putative heme-binding domain-containing protein